SSTASPRSAVNARYCASSWPRLIPRAQSCASPHRCQAEQMCGIYGQIALRDVNLPRAPVQDALRALYHRGPDDFGVCELPGVTLGMRRLSIIDLQGGHQPMWDAAGQHCIVYNGELYNYRDLRAQLIGLGHSFKTSSD